MNTIEYFKTPLWYEQKPEFLNSLNKASNKYIKEAKNCKEAKKHIKKYGDFGTSYHSTFIVDDNDFFDFRNYVGQKSWDFLDWQGFDLKDYGAIFTDMWVQEFASKGGGNHSAHIHSNNHVSGFYFLKCSDKTSYPVFHDPRTGARATKLKLKKTKEITPATEVVHFKPEPGTLLIFPGYLEHEFVTDLGIDPFRFIHWNIQAVPKVITKDD